MEAPPHFLHLIGYALSSTMRPCHLLVELTCSRVNSLRYSSLLMETLFNEKGYSAVNFYLPLFGNFIYIYISYMNETYTIIDFDIAPQVALNLRGLSPIFSPSFPSSLPLSICSSVPVPPLPPIHPQLTILFSFSREICRYIHNHPQAITL